MVGVIGFVLIVKYAGYLFTAGQIAMIEQGVYRGEPPQNVYNAGKAAIKARFATAGIYFGLKGITDSFDQYGAKSDADRREKLRTSNNP